MDKEKKNVRDPATIAAKQRDMLHRSRRTLQVHLLKIPIYTVYLSHLYFVIYWKVPYTWHAAP